MRVTPTKWVSISEFLPRKNVGEPTETSTPQRASAFDEQPQLRFLAGVNPPPEGDTCSAEQPVFEAVVTSSFEDVADIAPNSSQHAKKRVARRCDSTVGWHFVDFQAVGASSTGRLKTRNLKAFGGVQPEKAVTMPDYNSKTWRVVVRHCSLCS